MIPRRRIPIGLDSLVEMVRTPFIAAEQSEQDVYQFERAFAGYLGCDYARATASGREAMTLILDGLGLQAGDELIIPAYTLGELLPLIESRGIVARAADIDPNTFNVTARSIAAQITPNTRAVMIVHLHGVACDLDTITELTRRHHLKLIEDCAHALGGEYLGRKLGTFGDAALFSLEVNKALPTFGGGMVVSADPQVQAVVEQSLGKRPRGEWQALRKAVSKSIEELFVRSPLYGPVARVLFSERFARRFEQRYRSVNARGRGRAKLAYSGFQARLGLRRLPKLDERNQRLNLLAERFCQHLPGELVPQRHPYRARAAFYNFVVRYQGGDSVTRRRQFHQRGVDVGIGSEVMDDTANLLGQSDCPEASQLFHQAMILPLYDGMSEERFRHLCLAINRPPPEEDELGY